MTTALSERQARTELNLHTLQELRNVQNALRYEHEALRGQLAAAQAEGTEAGARLVELRAEHEALLVAYAAIVQEIEAVTRRLRG
jgi:predicted  nucleic acid-binding Zn-ribbon protein